MQASGFPKASFPLRQKRIKWGIVPGKATMKILFASDLHGHEALYRRTLAAGETWPADFLILGGDLLPSPPKAGGYEEILREQRAFIDGFLLPFFRSALETRFQKILLIPGNWDPAYPEIFIGPPEGLVDLDRKRFRAAEGYEFIGYPFVPPTPFRPKDYEKMDDPEAPWPPQKNPAYIRSAEPPHDLVPIDPRPYLLRKGTIATDLAALAPGGNPQKTVYVMHAPPFGTGLDAIAEGRFVGSRSIRKFIESSGPLLTLHGHIHEAPQISGIHSTRIGPTLCLNPGQTLPRSGEEPRLQAVFLDLENLGDSLRHTAR
jgi:uncharacterized protein